MGYDGAGGYSREKNFSAEASQGVKILASAVDAEFDDMASAFSLLRILDGRNAATDNLPMGGRRHVNVAAAVSGTDYLRANEFVTQVPIFVRDLETSDNSRVSVSAEFYATVSAGQAPPAGAKLVVEMAGFKSASCALHLNAGGGTAYSANLVDDHGNTLWKGALASGGIYDLIYSSAQSAWHVMNPSNTVVSVNCAIKVVDVDDGSVLGQESSLTIHLARSKNLMTVYALFTASISISAAKNNFRINYSADAFRQWVVPGGNHGSTFDIPIFNAGSAARAIGSFHHGSASARPVPGPSFQTITQNARSVSADVNIVIWPWTATVFEDLVADTD